MAVVNYLQLQAKALSVLQRFGAFPVTIKSLPDPVTGAVVIMKTVGVIDNGLVTNIENKQNPTVIGGMTQQLMYVPGTLKQQPDIGGEVSYTLNGQAYVQRISGVNSTQPTDTALLYTLSIE